MLTTDSVTPLLRGAIVPALVAGAVTTLVAALIAGGKGVLGSILGLAIVVLFSGVGLLVMRAVRSQDPMIAMTIAMASYAARVVLFGAALVVTGLISGIDDVLDRRFTAIAVVVCVIAWVAGEIRAFTKLRVPTYDIDLPKVDGDAGATS